MRAWFLVIASSADTALRDPGHLDRRAELDIETLAVDRAEQQLDHEPTARRRRDRPHRLGFTVISSTSTSAGRSRP